MATDHKKLSNLHPHRCNEFLHSGAKVAGTKWSDSWWKSAGFRLLMTTLNIIIVKIFFSQKIAIFFPEIQSVLIFSLLLLKKISFETPFFLEWMISGNTVVVFVHFIACQLIKVAVN